MTIHDPNNLGSLHIEIFATADAFQWFVVNHSQQRAGHLLIVAQGTDPSPFYAEAASRQAREDLIHADDERTARAVLIGQGCGDGLTPKLHVNPLATFDSPAIIIGSERVFPIGE